MNKMKWVLVIFSSFLMLACDKSDNDAPVNNACSQQMVSDHNEAHLVCSLINERSSLNDLDDCIEELRYLADNYSNVSCKVMNLSTGQEEWINGTAYKEALDVLVEARESIASDTYKDMDETSEVFTNSFDSLSNSKGDDQDSSSSSDYDQESSL
ncbi:MAG: hypothetical protein KDD58_13745 [Bdellovibrionales bacterium]|nr:hypothetical protein [Bdellovibrionales bacterium]